MWVYIVLIYISTPLVHGFYVWPFVASKICFDHDLHPVIRLRWNEEHFHLYKVANHPKEDGSYFLRSNWLPLWRVNIIAGFVNNQSAEFTLEKKGTVIWMPSSIKLQDLKNLDFFYQNLHLQHDFKVNFRKIEGERQFIESWECEFSLTRLNLLELKGTLSIACDKDSTHKYCRTVLATTHPRNRVVFQFGFNRNQTPDGGELFFGPLGDNLTNVVLNANWSRIKEDYTAQLELIHENQQIIEIKGNYDIQRRSLKQVATMDAYFKTLDLKSTILWEKRLIEKGSQIRFSAISNFFHQPSPFPLEYKFELREGSNDRFLDLRHNVSSELYYFEGNMTIDKEDALKGPSIITRIWQKIRSPISDSFKLNLEQVINQTGNWSWETTVMRSGFIDMHVSADWDRTILDFYSKKFLFKSHMENVIPDFNLLFSYSNRIRFHHRFELPFKGSTYELLLERSNVGSLLPFVMQLLYRNEFKSNSSSPIASIQCLDRREYFDIFLSSQPQLHEVLVGLSSFAKQVCIFVSGENSTLNKILQPVLGQRTVALWSKKLAKTISNFIREMFYDT